MIDILKQPGRVRPPIARSLGILSLMMSGAVVVPAWYGRLFGLQKHPRIMRAIGACDTLIGLGLLVGRERQRWLLLQAIADLIDAALVASWLRRRKIRRGRGSAWLGGALASTALACVASRQRYTAAHAKINPEMTKTRG